MFHWYQPKDFLYNTALSAQLPCLASHSLKSLGSTICCIPKPGSGTDPRNQIKAGKIKTNISNVFSQNKIQI